jgi:arylsulfatase
MADQFRRDGLRHFGNFGRTETLDALAADGASFRRAITNSPECISARFALATGLYPHQSGVWSNAPYTLSPSAWTWTHALAAAGYRTSLFGKTHFHEYAHPSGDLRDGKELMLAYGLQDVDEIAGPRASTRIKSAMTDQWLNAGLWDTFRRDYDERFASEPWLARPSPLGAQHHYDAYVGRRALEYLTAYDRPEPWFCWVSFAGPHEPWDAPVPFDQMHPAADAPAAVSRMKGAAAGSLLGELFADPGHAAPPDQSRIAALRANYAGNITLIDEQIGGLVDCLKASDAYDRTLILFTSDHGEMNGDQGLIYKSNFLDPAIDIPFIVRPPGGVRAALGRAAEEPVELIDAGATILDYAGVAIAASSNGRSVRAVLEGRSDYHRAYAVSEFKEHAMIETRLWKCEFDPNDEAVLLFDRLADPLEQQNLVEDSRSAPMIEALRGLLRAHRRGSSGRYVITQ